jgi:hypothetical protein
MAAALPGLSANAAGRTPGWGHTSRTESGECRGGERGKPWLMRHELSAGEASGVAICTVLMACHPRTEPISSGSSTRR